MSWLHDPQQWLARLVLQRGLAVIYLIAFAVAVNQFVPLLGERGLLPVPRFVARVPFRRSPSLFQLHYSDGFFRVVAWCGLLLAAVAAVGLPDAGPVWLPFVVWALLWALYLSIVNVGQTFYGFGWETLLVEAGFLAIFLGGWRSSPPTLVLWLFRWLVFRVEFGAGLIKLRGDPCWRDLTCLNYHHETQPMPGPFSWWFHHLPPKLHKVEVAANHFTQVVVPFALFAPQPVASVAAAIVVVTQCWLLASGNFSWLNAITIVLAAAAFDDAALHKLVRVTPPHALAAPGWHAALSVAVFLLVVVLSWWPIRNLVSRGQRMNSSFDPLRLVNTYGAFGSITRERYEVVIEATRAEDPTMPDAEWREYEFKGKPGDPTRRPPQVAPYHLRLDWLMWFAALSLDRQAHWLLPFLGKLLENDEPTLRLLRRNPFPDAPPRFVRAGFYRYAYTSWAERRRTGAWWVRERVGTAVPALSLASFGRSGYGAQGAGKNRSSTPESLKPGP